MTQQMKRTALFEAHQAHGGRLVPFAGWEMPVLYGSILEEVKAVRTSAGIFDVSHMGRFHVTGPGSGPFLSRVFSHDATRLKNGQARYGVLCVEDGGILDDCIVYRVADNRYLFIPNASNAAAAWDWLMRWSADATDLKIVDATLQLTMIALQGPKAIEILKDLTPLKLSTLKPYHITETQVMGEQVLLARTGYTGENGYEIMGPQEKAAELWEKLAEKGAKPCGLGARDVLRLEAGMPLHGNEIDLSTNPYEAGLERFVDADRDEYIPGAALRRIRDEGSTRALVGFNMVGRGIPRHGYAITDGSKQIGEVTSGGVAPSLDRNIGLGYVPCDFSAPGSRIHIDIRGRAVEAEVTPLPFYSRRRKA